MQHSGKRVSYFKIRRDVNVFFISKNHKKINLFQSMYTPVSPHLLDCLMFRKKSNTWRGKATSKGHHRHKVFEKYSCI